MTDLDALRIGLRVLLYVGSIAAAGGVLFRLSFPSAADAIQRDVARQIVLGACLILVIEPLRYVAFQLAIAGGDWAVAFGPDLRWMELQTPAGQAALTRMIAAAALLVLSASLPNSRWIAARATAALVMIASFALEGHTSSPEARTALGTGALFIHVAAVHWWLGALLPLLALTARAEPTRLIAAVEAFGRRAIWVVAALLIGGVTILAILTGARLDLQNAYQQRFLVKIALVAGLLAIAAWNKLRLTPLLSRDADSGRAKLATSIKVESLVGLAVLLATAWALSMSPED